MSVLTEVIYLLIYRLISVAFLTLFFFFIFTHFTKILKEKLKAFLGDYKEQEDNIPYLWCHREEKKKIDKEFIIFHVCAMGERGNSMTFG